MLSTENGKRTELDITNSMTEGKRCVTDISPDWFAGSRQL